MKNRFLMQVWAVVLVVFSFSRSTPCYSRTINRQQGVLSSSPPSSSPSSPSPPFLSIASTIEKLHHGDSHQASNNSTSAASHLTPEQSKIQQTLEQADAMIKTTERQDKLSRSSPHFVQRSDDSVDNSVDTADETSNTEDKGGTRSEYVAADVDVEKEASEENANRDVNADAQSEKEKHNAPLIFLHFHKTGGSSLCEVLRASGLKMTELQKNNNCNFRFDGPQLGPVMSRITCQQRRELALTGDAQSLGQSPLQAQEGGSTEPASSIDTGSQSLSEQTSTISTITDTDARSHGNGETEVSFEDYAVQLFGVERSMEDVILIDHGTDSYEDGDSTSSASMMAASSLSPPPSSSSSPSAASSSSNSLSSRASATSSPSLCPGFRYIAIFRDPLDRIASNAAQAHYTNTQASQWMLTNTIPHAHARGAFSQGSPHVDNFYIRSLLGASVYFSPLGSITRQHLNIAKDIVRQLDVVLVLDEVKDWGYVLREKLRIKSLNAYIDNQVEEVDEKEGSDDNAGVRRNMSLLMKPFNSHHHTHMSGKQFFQTAPFPASQSPSQSQSQSQVQPSTDNRSSGRSTSGSGGDGEEDTVDGYTYAMQLNALDYELYAYARSVADRQMRESKDALLHADNAHAQPQ